MYTYRCGDLGWSGLSGGATIGYNGGPVGNFYANHPLSGTSSVNSIACLNSGVTEWSNVVYNISCDLNCIPTEPPPTIEPRKPCRTLLLSLPPHLDIKNFSIILVPQVHSQLSMLHAEKLRMSLGMRRSQHSK